MTKRNIVLNIEDGVAEICLTRVKKMNALSIAMFDDIGWAIDTISGNRQVRAVVLHGEGPAFCAGIDLESLGDSGLLLKLAERTHGDANLFQNIAWGLHNLPVPVIAAVHGYAFGAGLQLMLGADIRYVAPDAELSVMEIRWGIVPDVAGFALLRESVRGDVARDLIYTGRRVCGTEAVSLGLATYAVPDPLNDARRAAKAIAATSPRAIRAAKRLLNLAEHADSASVLSAESAEQHVLLLSSDHAEAVAAAREKRKPVFS